jgi:chromate reductase, NAD(P)H dehydrogenase (quinone)
MSDAIRVGVMWGSLRKESMNGKLAKFVGKQISAGGDVEIDVIDLASMDLPMYNDDLSPMPAGANELKDRMIACDALIVACPEYNGSITGALKNAIDWASIPRDGDASRACFEGKVAGLLSSSPGPLGGIRGMRHVRLILSQLQMLVVPAEYALGGGHEAFDNDGNMIDETKSAMSVNVGQQVVRVCKALKASNL